MNSDNFVSGTLNFNPSAHQYKIAVYCDDCKNTLKEIPKGSVDLVVTSPKEGRLKTREIGTKIHKPKLTDNVARVPTDLEWKS